MRKLLLLIMTSLISVMPISAQLISGQITGGKLDRIRLFFPGQMIGEKYPGEILVVDSLGRFSYDTTIDIPEYIIMTNNPRTRNDMLWIRPLYVCPGDQLNIHVDIVGNTPKIEIKGKGWENNQLWDFGFNKEEGLEPFKGDTTPTRILSYLKEVEKNDRQELAEYSKKYRPSEDFIKNSGAQISYQRVENYYNFLESNKFKIREHFDTHRSFWYSELEALFSEIPLQSEAAIYSPNYQSLIRTSMLRKKEGLWRQMRLDPTGFYKEWFDMDVNKGEAYLNGESTNLICMAIIQRYFQGKVKEYAYAHLLDESLKEDLLDSISVVYSAFVKEFPVSKYREEIAKRYSEKLERYDKPLTDKMIFLDSTATAYNSFKDLLVPFKGKVVFIDMWGTWCGPCRSDIDAHSAGLKRAFKDRTDVVFLYVANHDRTNIEKWKKLIPFYNLEGYHVLANEQLTMDIMGKVEGNGFPTYIVVDKEGNYELAKSQFPMKPDLIIDHLKQKLDL